LITTGHQSADFTDVRATNLAVVLRFVRANAPCSRADIAAATGLNKATVSSLVAELIERRLMRETGLTENRIGRPATMLVLDGAGYAAIGLEVNTDHLMAVAIDVAGERLLSWRRAFAGRTTPPAKAVANVVALARRAVAKVDREILGLTVGVAGLVDGAGVVRLAPNLGWSDVDLREALAAALPDLPITVDNEANLAVLAEHRYGPYAGTADMVYINGQAGFGVGIIAGGHLVRGASGYGGELGHVMVEPGGPPCACGRLGCLEAVAAVGPLVRRLTGADPVDLEPEVDDLVRRARDQDPAVLSALRDAGRGLGLGLAVLSNVVNPHLVILGGYLADLAPWLVPAAEAEMVDHTVAPAAGGARIVVSTLGHAAAATGGAAEILNSVDAGALPKS
jgi:predicted NBD/HSP70 family sugar kinase